MGRNGLWLLAPIAVAAVAVTVATALGLGAVRASEGSQQAVSFDEGTVLHSSFLIGRGVTTGGQIEEITAHYWLRVGPDGQEDVRRAVLTDSEGNLLQEGIRHRQDSFGTTYFADMGEVLRTERPQQLPAVMWTEESVRLQLLGQDFKLLGESVIAGVPALVYEKQAILSGQPPDELLTAAGVDPEDTTGMVRRVFVGSEPFGVDLGGEAGYVLSDGSEFIPYYRRITLWEVLDEAPAGAFEWSPAAAGEVNR